MTKILNAENAQIITATVTVRALTIERRQVTLSVFRQLIEEHIVDFDVMRLRGVGWGHVRYLIEKPPDRAIHLVWQKGNELRRCIVERYQDRRTKSYKYQWDEAIILKDSSKRDPNGILKQAFFPAVSYSGWSWKKPPLGRFYQKTPDLKLERPKRPEGPGYNEPAYLKWIKSPEYLAYEQRCNDYQQVLAEHEKFRVEDRETQQTAYREEIRDLLQQEYDDHCAWCDQYEALVAPLFDLPQLFIAA